MSDDDKRLKYGVEVFVEEVQSELIPVIALLEELKRRNPKTFDIALEAVQKLEV